jgi:hypothetical protein
MDCGPQKKEISPTKEVLPVVFVKAISIIPKESFDQKQNLLECLLI